MNQSREMEKRTSKNDFLRGLICAAIKFQRLVHYFLGYILFSELFMQGK